MTRIEKSEHQMALLDGASEPIGTAPSPLLILDRLVQQGGSIEAIERMSALAERWQENLARQEFARAMAQFQRTMKPITKNRKADRFMYAGFDDIMREASPVLADCGISVGFDSEQNDKVLSVKCRIRVGAYHEDRSFSVPIPLSLKVSEPQQYGAALSYAKRYCLCAALNIVVTDEDNENAIDGVVDKNDVMEMNEMFDRFGMGEPEINKFLAVWQIPSIDQMPKSCWQRAKPMLEAKYANKGAKR